MQQFDFFRGQGRREGGRNIPLKVNYIRRPRENGRNGRL